MLKYMIKKDYVNITKILLENYQKININEKELVMLLNLIEQFKVDQLNISNSTLAKKLNISVNDCNSILNSLLNKGIITLSIEYTKTGKAKEVISIDEFIILIEKTINDEIKNQTIQSSENKVKEIIDLCEKAFNKTLTPYELDIVISWVESNETIQTIKTALDISMVKKATNLRYVDKVLLATKNTNNEKVDEDKSKVLDDLFRNIK